MKHYQTCNQSCAVVLRYVLGDECHIRTYRRQDGRMSFQFADPDGEAAEIARLFFEPEGVAIGNARELLECDRVMRGTVGMCLKQGEWRNG